MRKTAKVQKNPVRNAAYINCLSEFIYRIRSTQFCETQETFGDRCQLSQKTISRLENTKQRHMITLDSLCNISRGIGVFPSQLLAQNERMLSLRNPKQIEDYKQDITRFDAFPDELEDGPADEVLRMLQASLMFFRLLQTKEYHEITCEDLDPLYVFLQK